MNQIRTVSTLLVALTSGLAWPALALEPSTNRKYVCDFAFSGPNAGSVAGVTGRESRRFVGSPASYTSRAWWGNGNSAEAQQVFTMPSGLTQPPGTRWQVLAQAPNLSVTGKVDVRLYNYLFGSTRRVTYHDTSNGVHLDCMELSSAALGQLHGPYQAPAPDHGVCACAYAYDYASTVACLTNCTDYWNADSRWPEGAPECLGSGSIVKRLACVLNHSPDGPAEHPQDDTCGVFHNAPGCPGYGEGDGGSCGWGNAGFCQPGCMCLADNTCHCPPAF